MTHFTLGESENPYQDILTGASWQVVKEAFKSPRHRMSQDIWMLDARLPAIIA